ncbi:MAG: beta-eliminating lyase-related protein [Candidatus Tectomicrobia bacterium]
MQQAINFIHDGLHLTPLEYVQALQPDAEAGSIHPDSYSNGGIVEELERKFAHWLGKPHAVFMPTGTLANHLALRELAGPYKKVIVQAESHLYNDTGDCAQTLSGLNLIPLAPHQAAFSLEQVQDVVRTIRSGRVETRVGVISIETPVRRQDDAMFGYDDMQRIASFARQEGIKLHLDGARLFVESAHTGIAPAQYAALFDTVYVSLSKCFNAAAGAILAGPVALTENLYHIRRMFGGSLAQAWPNAAVALQFVDDFIEAYRSAWREAETLFQLLDDHHAFRVEHIPDGTHIVRLHIANTNLKQFRDRLMQHHIHLPPVTSGQGWFSLKINPSLNRSCGRALAEAFMGCIGKKKLPAGKRSARPSTHGDNLKFAMGDSR